MTIEQPKEYEQEKEAIREKYLKKHKKILRNYLIGLAAAGTLVFSSLAVEDSKLKNLEKIFPIYQEYIDNQDSIRYLKNKLNQYKPERFPVFLSKPIKNELENISIREDSSKISSLEKLVKIAEQDNARIVDSPEFKEYSEKKEKINNVRIFYRLGLGSLIASILGLPFLSGSYIKRKDKELTVLDKKYGIVPEES